MIGPELRDVVAIAGWTKRIITNEAEAEAELSSNITHTITGGRCITFT